MPERPRTHHGVYRAPFVKHGERRDATYPVLRGDDRIRVRVELDEFYLARVFGRKLLHDRRHHAAGTAPRCPEINEYRKISFHHLGLPGLVGYFQWVYCFLNLIFVCHCCLQSWIVISDVIICNSGANGYG